MKLNFDDLEVKRKINLLAEICCYGIEYQIGLPNNQEFYSVDAIEVVAHIFNCCIVQYFQFENSSTTKISEFLYREYAAGNFETYYSISEWEQRITKYLKEGVDGQQN